ncbi:hypothetical protein C1H76_8104 [Elsinoe australis]|uniref:Uncharacterized protein n=1 Tax=Elsinoe australis TaxID=40998 RepID=A0A4U7ATV3_9PEZI|nr:hypothetical protein C1H76_8104 [Elsinoe australis]
MSNTSIANATPQAPPSPTVQAFVDNIASDTYSSETNEETASNKKEYFPHTYIYRKPKTKNSVRFWYISEKN